MIRAETEITLTRVSDGKSAYEAAQQGGYVGDETQFNTDLAEMPSNIEDITDEVAAQQETIGSLQGDVASATDGVASLNNSVSVLTSKTEALEGQASNELVARGYATITEEPSLELGKTDSKWKVKITNESVDLNKSGVSGAKLSPNPTRPNETLFRTDTTRLANLYFRSADGQGKLGIVAQSNGHISLKEI